MTPCIPIALEPALDLVQTVAAERGVTLSRGQAGYVLWNCTGWPGFFDLPDHAEAIRRQTAEWFDSAGEAQNVAALDPHLIAIASTSHASSPDTPDVTFASHASTPDALDAALDDVKVAMGVHANGQVVLKAAVEEWFAAQLAVLAEIAATAKGHGASDADKTRLNRRVTRAARNESIAARMLERQTTLVDETLYAFDTAFLKLENDHV